MDRLFLKDTGSSKLQRPGIWVGIILLTIVLAVIIGLSGLTMAAGLIFALLFLVFLTFLVKYPQSGLYAAIGLGFVLLGATRYIITTQPVGLLMDAILLLTFIGLILNKFPNRVNWKPVNKDIFYLSLIWVAYCGLQVINPEARSFDAWFAAIRPIGLYMLLFSMLSLLFINNPKRLKILFIIWGIFSILATFKGMIQHFVGVDSYEKAWLDAGGSITHILFGKLRVFSFYSDAGQFGANQAYTGVVFTILALSAQNTRDRVFYIVVGLLGFYGMILSGTRGAIFVAFAGFALFFLHKKNLAIMVLGIFLGIGAFTFFKFTRIGQGNAQIARMRSAFDPNDASLLVRLENQRRLKIYMANKPFGAGLGHGGVKAQKYLPNAFLSNVPTDSWYVLIWVELGVIGLVIHLFIQFYILIRGSYYLMFVLRDKTLIASCSALASGMLGIMLASYGNAIIGQMPTSPLIYTGMAVLLSSPVIDKYIRVNKRKKTLHLKYHNRLKNNNILLSLPHA